MSDTDPARISAMDYTPEQIESAIAHALRERDLKAAVSLLHMLAVRAPDRAQLIADWVEVAGSGQVTR